MHEMLTIMVRIALSPLFGLILGLAGLAGLTAPSFAETPAGALAGHQRSPQASSAFGKAKVIDLMGASVPQSLLYAAGDRSLWFAAPKLGAVGRIDLATGKPVYFHLGKGARPVALAEGPDRLIYVADRALNVIHRIKPDESEIIRIPLPAEAPHIDLAALSFDNDGRLWFSGAAGWLGSHDLAGGQSEVSSHDDLVGLAAVARAPNGAIFFVAGKSGRMLRLEPGKPRYDSSLLPDSFRRIRSISAGNNGELWISSYNENAIAVHGGRGKWQKIALPWPDSQPHALLARRDGSLLIADAGRRKLVRYLPKTGQFDELADLGDGGALKSLVETDMGVALADAGADHILLFREEMVPGN